MMPKSIETVTAIFGTMQAGAAYVPIDPTAPVTRGRTIAADELDFLDNYWHAPKCNPGADDTNTLPVFANDTFATPRTRSCIGSILPVFNYKEAVSDERIHARFHHEGDHNVTTV